MLSLILPYGDTRGIMSLPTCSQFILFKGHKVLVYARTSYNIAQYRAMYPAGAFTVINAGPYDRHWNPLLFIPCHKASTLTYAFFL